MVPTLAERQSVTKSRNSAKHPSGPKGAGSLDRIAAAFRTEFARWGLEIPRKALASRKPGFIHDAGWLIQFTFGSDARGEFLDYYSTHRFAGDDHVRLYESGRRQRLAALHASYVTRSVDPAETEHAEREYFRKNRRIARQLAAKGFDKFTLNMALHAGIVGRDGDPPVAEAPARPRKAPGAAAPRRRTGGDD
jgi:hypothetical protein